jgi:hypothetical protein
MVRSAISLSFAGIIWASTAFAGGPYGFIHVGNWNGGAYTNDSTGAFSHCGAGMGYNNGVNLAIAQKPDGAWLLGFLNAAWRNAAGETFPIDVTFDAQAQFHLFGVANASGLIAAVLPNDVIIEQLRKSHMLLVTMKGITLLFNLNFMGELLPMIANCVTTVKTAGIKFQDFTVLPPRPSPPSSPAKSIAATSAPPRPAPKREAEGPTKPRVVDVNGTGFVVSIAGHIVTNNHVIDKCVGDVHGKVAMVPRHCGSCPGTKRMT